MKNNCMILKGSQKYNFSDRMAWIDLLRGGAILLVMLGHCQPPFYKAIYGFHMPLFFMVSGFLFKPNFSLENKNNNSNIGYIEKLSIRYLIPYFILCGINLLLYSIFYKFGFWDEFPLKRYLIGILYSYGTKQYMPNCSPLWYLTCIFVAMLGFKIIHDKVKKLTMQVCVVMLCGIISSFLDVLNFPKLPWNIDTALMGIVFLEIGFIIKKYNLLNKLLAFKSWKTILSSIAMCVIGIFVIMQNSIVDFDTNNYGNSPLMIIGALCITIPLMLVAVKLENKKNILSDLLIFLGNHTIFIIGFDYFFGSVAVVLLRKVGLLMWTTKFTVKTATIVIALLIYSKMIRNFPNEKMRTVLQF